MNKDALNKLIASYIIAVGPDGSPSSHVWLLLDPQMTDVHKHNVVLTTLCEAGLLSVTNHFVTLTDKGLALFTKLAVIYMKKKLDCEPSSSPYDGLSQEEKDKAHAAQIRNQQENGA